MDFKDLKNIQKSFGDLLDDVNKGLRDVFLPSGGGNPIGRGSSISGGGNRRESRGLNNLDSLSLFIKKAEYEERQRIRAQKHREYLERERIREQKHREYLERQRIREQKHREYLERQLIKEQKHREYLERQRTKEQKHREHLERQRINEQKHSMHLEHPQVESRKHRNSTCQKKTHQEIKITNKKEAIICFEQNPIEKKSANSPAYRKGNNPDIKTVFMLSAPGRFEEIANRPAAGQTGKTLSEALIEWNKINPNNFPSSTLDDYTIVNSVEDVHYKEKTGRTEGRQDEILSHDNMTRIKDSLSGIDTIVALGNRARLAVDSSGFDGKIFYGEHPSMQSLNKKYDSQKNNPDERRKERTSKWAKSVLDEE